MQILLLAVLLLPQGYAELFTRGHSLLEAGKPREAQRDLEAALALRPENANCAYALACTSSAAGDLAGAARWLKQATDWGYDDPAVAAWDPDLEALRKGTGWKELLGGIEARFQARPKEASKLAFDWGLEGWECSLNPDKSRLLLGRGGLGYLYSLADHELLAVLSRHGEYTVHARFTADGRRILRATGDDKFEVWDGATGVFLRELEGPGYWQGTLISSREGTRVVGYGCGPNSGIGVWDLETGKLLRRIPVGNPAIVAISPDGSHALIVDDSRHGKTSVGIWDLDRGVELAKHEDCGRPTFQAGFNSDGSIAFGMSEERCRVVLYDGRTGAELRTIDDSGAKVRFPRFGKGTKELVIQTESGALRWIDTSDGSVKRSVDIGKRGWGSLAVDPSGRSIVSTQPHDPWDGGGRIEVFDADTGATLWQRDRPEDMTWMGGVSCSPDGALLTLSSEQGRFEIVEARTGRILDELAPPALLLDAETGSEPESCLLGALGGPLRRVALSTGETLASAPVGGGGLRAMIASKDGQRLLVFRADRRASVFSAGSLEPVCDLATDMVSKAWSDLGVRFCPDGEHLALWNHGEQFETCSVHTGARELHQKLENARIRDIDWSHDGRLLAVADGNGSVQLFEARTGAAFGPRVKFPAEVGLVRFSPVDDRFVVAGASPVVLMFEPGSDKPLFELSHKTEDLFGGLEVSEAVFSPDGSCVVTTTQSGGDVVAWDARKGNRLWTSSCGGGNPVPLYARFDRAGTRLAHYGQTIQSPRVLDAKNGSMLVDFSKRGYGWLDFSADGKRLLATRGDSLQVLQAADGALLYERVEMAGGDAFLRSESMHVDASRAALRHVEVLYAGASYPLDGFATSLLDPKRVRAAAAGIHVAPAIVPEPPALEVLVVDGRKLVTSGSCPAGMLGFEVELDGRPLAPALVHAATKLEDEARRARLELPLEGPGAGSASRIRVCAVARSGISSRPRFAALPPAPK